MPKINGFEFVENAKEKCFLYRYKPVIILMLTSSLNPDDEQMAKEKFSDEIGDFKAKPLTKEMIKDIIENFF